MSLLKYSLSILPEERFIFWILMYIFSFPGTIIIFISKDHHFGGIIGFILAIVYSLVIIYFISNLWVAVYKKRINNKIIGNMLLLVPFLRFILIPTFWLIPDVFGIREVISEKIWPLFIFDPGFGHTSFSITKDIFGNFIEFYPLTILVTILGIMGISLFYLAIFGIFLKIIFKVKEKLFK